MDETDRFDAEECFDFMLALCSIPGFTGFRIGIGLSMILDLPEDKFFKILRQRKRKDIQKHPLTLKLPRIENKKA